eukprot:m.419940 g.419940  ORF g.419940 m.419940 type:complete len:279 (-) comp31946_c0_seq1:516-1352(-)
MTTTSATETMVALLEHLALEANSSGRDLLEGMRVMMGEARQGERGGVGVPDTSTQLVEHSSSFDDNTVRRTPRDVGEMVKMLADATTAERHTTLTALQYQANIIHTLTVEIALFQDSELCTVGEKEEGTSDGARYVTTCAAVKGVELTRALLLRQLAEERDQHEVALDDVEDHLATELRIHGLTPQESNRTRRTILREKHEAHEAEDARQQAAVETELLQEARTAERNRLTQHAKHFRETVLMQRLAAEERELAEAEAELDAMKHDSVRPARAPESQN